MIPAEDVEVAARTIIQFLEARIAEDERQAGICLELGWSPARKYGITAVGPARTLAECAAKRAIIGLHRRTVDVYEDALGDTCTMCTGSRPDAQPFPCSTMQALAAVYADHPDYRQEWARG